MIKKLSGIILCIMLCLTLPVTAFAAVDPRLNDEADLLIDNDESLLLDKLDAIYDAYEIDVVIVTVNSLDGKTPAEYADDYYDYHTFNYSDKKDGILLLINMGERDWQISTTGEGMVIFDDSTWRYMADQILPYLSGGDYYGAFDEFATLSEEILESYDANGVPPYYGEYNGTVDDYYDDYYNDDYYNDGYSSDYRSNSGPEPMWIPASIAIGMVISLLIMLGFRSQLKSVRRKSVADDYKVPGSMIVTEQSDMFLYHHVTRTPRQTQNNSRPGGGVGGGGVRVGSSGRSHGGGGGKF